MSSESGNTNKIETPDVDSSTDDYATRFAGKIGTWFLQIQRKATLSFLSDSGTPLSIIDVGGGHAQNIEGILTDNHSLVVTGSEDICFKRVWPYLENDRSGKLSTLCCPLTNIPAADNEYDVAVSYRMLSHLENWQEFIAELCRISGKSVIVDYPTIRSVNAIGTLFFFLKKGVEKNTRNYIVFKEQEVVDVFSNNGFVLKGKVGQFVFPMALHRMHKQVWLASFLERICGFLGLSWLFGSPVIACFERSIPNEK